jgi:predicted alpha-1,2-mannosidase
MKTHHCAVLFIPLLLFGCSAQEYKYSAPAADFSGYTKTSASSIGAVLPDMSSMLIRYVDPFIGTGGHGHTYPGATMPFGMVQISPDNEFYGWDWCSGYNWYGKKIIGFSHKHLSGTGARELGDISFLPSSSKKETAAEFSHRNEFACPGYYAVHMDNGIFAEFTAGMRSAYHRYTFGSMNKGYLNIDLTHDISGKGESRTLQSSFSIISATQLGGCRISRGWVPVQRVYFFAEFSSPYRITSTRRKAVLEFDAKTVSVKVGISSVSIESARENMRELEGKKFEQAVLDAGEAWEKELRKFTVQGKSDADKSVFYTAIYHSCLAPVMYSDADGGFTNPDGSTMKAEGYTRYSTFSLWDTFRAAHPLYTLTQKKRVNDFIRSMLSHFDAAKNLPRWELEASDTDCMIGNHALPVIVEAYLKGIRGYDVQKAYAACRETLSRDSAGMKEYRRLGYVPADSIDESVSRTLEYAYDDWCMSHFAEALGKNEDAVIFLASSKNYRNLFDSETMLMRPKNSDGTWVTAFDPYAVKKGTGRHYTEGDAAQWTWSVFHDKEGIEKLFGGKKKLGDSLSKLFAADQTQRENQLADVTGLIGDYAHGNEPSHHVAYLFNWTDRQDETSRLVHRICSAFYTDKPDGLCGNEDCGQMSAWYIFSAIGFYPVDPVSLRYQLGTPRFDAAVIHLESGRDFTVRAIRNESSSIVPYKITLNGRVLDRRYITFDEIQSGGELMFYLR